jgi:hypothetical protein
MSSTAADILNRELPNTLTWSGRFRLTVGVVACYAIFWWGSVATGVPAVHGTGGSLLSQPAPLVAMLATGAGILICAVVGRLIVGHLPIGNDLQCEGGLLAATLGMLALVFRLGPVSYALFYMDDPQAYVLLAAELAMVYVVVGFCWMVLFWLTPTSGSAAPSPAAVGLAATGTHVVVMAACMVFLCQSTATAQGVAAVGISALLASMAAHTAFPVRSSGWFLLGPAIVGVIGYLVAFMYSQGLAIGFPEGPMAALARPTPLAYASAGPAGAIFGYWTAYRWHVGEAAA